MARLPNLVYIGPDKAGSSWLFKLFNVHPDIYVTPAKDIYFFDRYYDKGMDWYAKQFAGCENQKIVSEISHDYLYDEPAIARIKEHMPDAKLMVSLREPAERTFSAYLHLIKSGNFEGTFEEAIEAQPQVVDNSCYGKHINMVLKHFDVSQLCVAVFDDLKKSPQTYADKIFTDIGVSTMELPESVQEKSLPAGKSRSVLLTQGVRRMSNLFRDIGMPGIVGQMKSSKLVQKFLYRPYASGEKPKASEETKQSLREVFRPDVALLDETLGTNFSELWKYSATTGAEVLN